MKSILSTKKLTLSQKELCLQAGVSVIEYNAIKIDFLPVSCPKFIKNAIFTSKNGVKAVFSASYSMAPKIENCFCVGEKTAAKLRDLDQNLLEIGENSAALGQFLIENHKKEVFYYFAGEQRLDILPDMLRENNISIEEVISYRTLLNPKKFDRFFEIVCFYSPSGVQSYSEHNNMEHIVACCIGTTTASEAKKHTRNIIIANKPTVASTLTQAIKFRINERT
ncbi:uroporphyrinogen-III synthase [Altibacter sp. HG106]|uniref:uroporphyrinogen-III synthase n=1 Tax=Altibacter sp. HG106 TaxID=3023937 RepID=UPI0023502009|nr:uroporphyrinogen-III synthase [Altibacter sp. HG106]MDC7995070.1 uroporphyrinogen-III synthase [Altibacter sp. HG106]